MRVIVSTVIGLGLLSLPGTASLASPSSEQNTAKNSCQYILERKSAVDGSAKKYAELLKGKDACKHVGEIATVEFLVDNTHECRKGLIYLNESKDYKTCFAAVISAASRKNFPADAEKEYTGKLVKVTGKIELYGGTPKIILEKPSAVQVVTK